MRIPYLPERHARLRPRKTNGLLPAGALAAGLLLPTTFLLAEDTLLGPPSGCGYGCDYFTYPSTGNRIDITGQFPPEPWDGLEMRTGSCYWDVSLPWRTGWTTELKLDLLHAELGASGSADELFTVVLADSWPEPQQQGGYALAKDLNEIALLKYHTESQPFTVFFWEEREIKHENVTLILSLTRQSGGRVLVGARVEDLDHPGKVLYARSFLDGPGVDAPAPDPAPKNLPVWRADNGPAYALRNCVIATWDATPGEPPQDFQVIVENYRYASAPILNLDRAICLNWAPIAGFHVEVAETPDGPWNRLAGAVESDNAALRRRELWVTANDGMRFYRLAEDETP